MKKCNTLLLLLFFIGNFYQITFAQKLVLTQAQSVVEVNPYLLVYQDNTRESELTQILKPENQTKFKAIGQTNFGFMKNNLWLKFEVQNQSGEDVYLILQNPNIDYLDFYLMDNQHIDNQELIGLSRAYQNRSIPSHHFAFHLKIPQNQSRSIYLKIRTERVARFPLKIFTEKSFLAYHHQADLFYGIFYGIMLIIFLTNLFIYFSVYEKAHLYYILYLVSMFFLISYLNGYGISLIWLNTSWLQNYNAVFVSLASIFNLAFVAHYLKLKTRLPLLYRWAYGMTGLGILNILVALLGFTQFSIQLNFVLGISIIILVSLLIINLLQKKINISAYFLIGWIVLAFATFCHILILLKILPWASFANPILEIGNLIEMVFFSFALADKINIFKSANEKAEEANLELIREQNLVLEDKVKKRTHQIEQQKEELQSQTEELRIINEKLIELDKFKEGMTGMIVHDLKNPLNTILGLSDQEEVRQAGKQMLNMVLNILDVQKFESAEFKLQMTDYPLLKIVNEALYEVKILLERKSLFVENSIPLEFVVRVDFDIAVRVFVNLLTNAIKYTPNNGKISLSAQKSPNFIQFEITDTGQGIPADKIHLIFDKFSQLEAKQSGTVRSTGLGLTFCKMAVEAHGGQIAVHSSENKGTSFEFTLPKGELGKLDNNWFQEITPFYLPKNEIVKLSTQEKVLLMPYLEQLKSLTVYEYSDVRNVLEKINGNLNNNLLLWKKQMENALKACNEEKYNELIGNEQGAMNNEQ